METFKAVDRKLLKNYDQILRCETNLKSCCLINSDNIRVWLDLKHFEQKTHKRGDFDAAPKRSTDIS